jgi:hypothetical protein
MPFAKVGKDDYTSPSGRHFNQKQVNLYYASDGFNKGKLAAMHKGSGPKTASYAKGGPVLGRVREFIKEPDSFRTDKGKQEYGKGSGDSLAKRTGDKCLTPVKPKK